ncbi:MAG TPA: hypothetical protein ENJ18_15860 [Nannocystis exedens]|nr:hypothetical protein [Nannocystis exedens]
MPFGGEEDVAMGKALWTEIDGHIDNWDAYPGKEGLVAGTSPHGAWQQLRINDVAANDPANPVDGYIIVKDNYLEMDEATLDSVTVMKKIDGYNPDAADWFWAKYKPDGTLLENPDGVALAGAIGQCIGCHAGGGGGDYLYIND